MGNKGQGLHENVYAILLGEGEGETLYCFLTLFTLSILLSSISLWWWFYCWAIWTDLFLWLVSLVFIDNCFMSKHIMHGYVIDVDTFSLFLSRLMCIFDVLFEFSLCRSFVHSITI
jgi:hypothetical protein